MKKKSNYTLCFLFLTVLSCTLHPMVSPLELQVSPDNPPIEKGALDYLPDHVLFKVFDNLTFDNQLKLAGASSGVNEIYREWQHLKEAMFEKPELTIPASKVAFVSFASNKNVEPSRNNLALINAANQIGFKAFTEFTESGLNELTSQQLYKKIYTLIRKYLVYENFSMLIINPSTKWNMRLKKDNSGNQNIGLDAALLTYEELSPNKRPIVLLEPNSRGTQDRVTFGYNSGENSVLARLFSISMDISAASISTTNKLKDLFSIHQPPHILLAKLEKLGFNCTQKRSFICKQANNELTGLHVVYIVPPQLCNSIGQHDEYFLDKLKALVGKSAVKTLTLDTDLIDAANKVLKQLHYAAKNKKNAIIFLGDENDARFKKLPYLELTREQTENYISTCDDVSIFTVPIFFIAMGSHNQQSTINSSIMYSTEPDGIAYSNYYGSIFKKSLYFTFEYLHRYVKKFSLEDLFTITKQALFKFPGVYDDKVVCQNAELVQSERAAKQKIYITLDKKNNTKM